MNIKFIFVFIKSSYYFFGGNTYELKHLLLVLSKIKNFNKKKQSCILVKILNDYKINANKLKWFILNNASNDNTTLFKFSKSIYFLFLKKQLRFVSYIINLIFNAFLYGQTPINIKTQLTLDLSKMSCLIL